MSKNRGKQEQGHPKAKKKHKRHKKWNTMDKVITIFLLFFIVVLVVDLCLVYVMRGEVNQELQQREYEKIPAKLQITKLTNPGCEQCYDIETVVSTIEQNNVNLTEEKTVSLDSAEAQELITKYGIEKAPALIVKGETNRTEKLEKSLKSLLEEKEGALVFDSPKPPYTLTEDSQVVGLVEMIQLKPDACAECANLTPIGSQMASQLGFELKEKRTVSSSSVEGKEMIENYNLTKLPMLMFSEEALEYSGVEGKWASVGTVEDDGMLVLRQVRPPYYDLASGKVKGVVNVTYLADQSCGECYNVSIHNQILTNPQEYNMYLKDEKYVDISEPEGQELVEKYDITAVPTFVMTEEAKVYQALNRIWPQVGSVEDDGTYVFRNVSVMGVAYKNLDTGEVVQPSR